MRTTLLALAIAAFLLVVVAHDTQAAPYRAGNPYSSFNISGINYGSQQWEKSRSKSKSSSSRRSFFGGFRFR